MEEKIHWLKQFVLYVLQRFNRDGCSAIAAELTVTSLLSLVPFLTVIFSLIALFPQFQNMEQDVQSWIFQNFIPESSQTIQSYLNQYVSNTKGLTTIGMVFLVVTALLLMRTIDRSFNRIWQVQEGHSPVRVFLVYWAVLTMGPLLLATSLGVSSYFASLPMISDVVKSNGDLLSRSVPLLMAFIAFSVMFVAVPNRPVKIWHALVAALITAVFFEVAKWGFGVFVSRFSTYQLIFGALAALPLFLIWMLFSWMIVLLGAEICHALDVFQIRQKKEINQPFILASRILKSLLHAQAERRVLDLDELNEQLQFAGMDDLMKILDELESAKLVIRLDNGGYSLAGDTESYRINDLLDAGFLQLPDEKSLDELESIDSQMALTLKKGMSALYDSFNDPLVNESNPSP